MEIRRGRPEDAAAIADVHHDTWVAAYAHVFGAGRLAAMDRGRRRTVWERVLATEASVAVADDDGRIVGFVSTGASRDAGAGGELFAIYVLPEAWGSGAGPGLMRAGLAALREAGHADAILWVLEDNPRARRFYEREGWSLDGARKEEELLGVAVTEVATGSCSDVLQSHVPQPGCRPWPEGQVAVSAAGARSGCPRGRSPSRGGPAPARAPPRRGRAGGPAAAARSIARPGDRRRHGRPAA
ncbi:MAG: GNAT family N-acetyltransferase [Gaiellaceae bacterium]